ncbi:hypothetical protein ACNOYE_26215 [Nannocystaceae bacterium ST9]
MTTDPERLSRVDLHRGDTASWIVGEQAIGFHAGMGLRPVEVYVPTAAAWKAHTPEWAHGLRDEILADFRARDLRVVELANAWGFDLPMTMRPR